MVLAWMTKTLSFDMYQKAKQLMELSGQRMVPQQDQAPKGIHLWRFKREITAAKGVTIREYECPLRFVCDCRIGLCTVEGVGYIQLERRGVHHIDSHVNANNELNDDEPPELDGSDDEDDDFDSDDDWSDDEDVHHGDAGESVSADVGL
jgi:hypothetical protein